ncbi:MAG: hypothetical protein CMO30_07330 [Tistrella sp.]|jgi:hypothetical protein|uniref:Uncharacterized protein n=2 Tax=Tistrella mobilis TaxID=171437 RepID=I3TQG2_TISMK|nr:MULTISPECIES: hypothetical protein [Tistrella]AFK55000.1 hypothetical protein TMO_3162 [Tistrella mobilis KA081020-065]KYO57422.1 hypothetical protein AUP44_20210 [Tistrella mobilis]MAD37006.1 hypothetical protein [Tistrella sp.]MAM74982.1 hypothetical protein [Tistrella sp.]MBA75079.1 hypothetical protein [Tistrella sp.]
MTDRETSRPALATILAVNQREAVERVEAGDGRPLWRLIWFGASRIGMGDAGLEALQDALGEDFPDFLAEVDRGEEEAERVLELDLPGDGPEDERAARAIAVAANPSAIVFSGVFEGAPSAGGASRPMIQHEDDEGEELIAGDGARWLAVVAVDRSRGRLALSRVVERGGRPTVVPPAGDDDLDAFHDLIDWLAGWAGWTPVGTRTLDS